MHRTTSAMSRLTARSVGFMAPPGDAGYSRAVALVNEVLRLALRARSDMLFSAHARPRRRGARARGGGAAVHALPGRPATARRAGRPLSRGERGSAGDRRWDAVARIDKRRRARAHGARLARGDGGGELAPPPPSRRGKKTAAPARRLRGGRGRQWASGYQSASGRSRKAPLTELGSVVVVVTGARWCWSRRAPSSWRSGTWWSKERATSWWSPLAPWWWSRRVPSWSSSRWSPWCWSRWSPWWWWRWAPWRWWCWRAPWSR